jgi:preprotein translocase subunit SecG
MSRTTMIVVFLLLATSFYLNWRGSRQCAERGGEYIIDAGNIPHCVAAPPR